ncbi:MAG: ribosomal-processing cysteine protease Prp, partial [Coprobacillus sp.]|nr:ribosomal-processing cysteine protease Prp [Coprobacillus sp.]
MISVQLNYINDKFKSLTVNGHADSGPEGEDLVCAAVSAIITGGFNSIKDQESFTMELNSGNAKLIAKTDDILEHDLVVIETIVTSLDTIKESYPKYI